LAKQAAALYYDCFQRLHDTYAKDWAHYSYLADLFVSEAPSGSRLRVIKTDTVVEDGANDLAGSTAYADVRQAALLLRKTAQREINEFQSSPP
jgi:hypothetical protein